MFRLTRSAQVTEVTEWMTKQVRQRQKRRSLLLSRLSRWHMAIAGLHPSHSMSGMSGMGLVGLIGSVISVMVSATPATSIVLPEKTDRPSPLYLAQHLSELISEPPGLCYLSEQDLSGRWITDGTGGVVPLATICQAAFAIQESRVQENGDVIPLSPEETTFWQTFSNAASAEAWEFTQSLEVDAVLAYAGAICLSLETGASMTEIREIQVEGNLPSSFDAAVNVAAIHSYCPQFSGEIGR